MYLVLRTDINQSFSYTEADSYVLSNTKYTDTVERRRGIKK